MGMQIRRAEDLDMRQVLAHAPQGESAFRLRALLQGAEVHVSRSQPNACVIHLVGQRPKIFLNPDFVEEYVDNYYELFTLIFHEMTHIVVGHFIEPKVKLLFGDSFWKTRKGKEIAHFVTELLIKHIENAALPDDHYHTISEKYFRHLGEPHNVLFRGTPDEEIADPFLQQLHTKAFHTGSYSAREAAYILRRLAEAKGEDGADGQEDGGMGDNPRDNVKRATQASAGEGDEQDTEDDQHMAPGGAEPPEEESEEEPPADQDDDNPDDDSESGASTGDDEEEGEGEGGDDREEDEGEGDDEDSEGEDEDGDDEGDDGEDEEGEGDDETQEDDGPNGPQSSADDEGLQQLMAAMADMSGDGASEGHRKLSNEVQEVLESFRIRNLSEIKRATAKVFAKPGLLSQVGRIFRERTGRSVEYSIIPDTRHDKRAAARMAAGVYTPYYRKPVYDVESKFTMYFDISGSQYEYIPTCNELVVRLKPYLADDGLILFSDYVVPIRLPAFSQAVSKGEVINYSSGGTSFNAVIDDMMRRKLERVVILTDNWCQINGAKRRGYLEHIKETGFLLLLLTEDVAGGFRPFANHEILIDHEQND